MTATSEAPPRILDIPIGLDATGKRREFDSHADVEVPADQYWGAQTQASLEHFNIGNDRVPKEVYHAYGYVKKGRHDRGADRRSDGALLPADRPAYSGPQRG